MKSASEFFKLSTMKLNMKSIQIRDEKGDLLISVKRTNTGVDTVTDCRLKGRLVCVMEDNSRINLPLNT